MSWHRSACPPWQGMTTKFGSLIIYVVCLNWWYLSCFQDFLICFCKTFIFCSYLSFSVSFSLMMFQNISEFVSKVTFLHFDSKSFWHFWINKWIWIKIIMYNLSKMYSDPKNIWTKVLLLYSLYLVGFWSKIDFWVKMNFDSK